MRSRLRKLHAHDREFAWQARIDHVRTGRERRRCIRLRIRGAGRNSRALQVDLLSTAPMSPSGPPDDSYPTPQHVRAVIDHALAYGWQLDLIGGTFTLSGAGHARELSLPGFVVTDLLQFAQRPALVG